MTPPENAIKQARTTARTRVLVSGASFAGLASAFWMSRLGYDVTVVEIAKQLRKGGTPVDLEGEAIDVLTRMGIIDNVRAKALPPRTFQFKNADDTEVGKMLAQPASDDAKYEIHRDDLLEILLESVAHQVEIVFGRSIAQITEGPNGVAVRFVDGAYGDYALLLGCDGNRSNTRRLAFGQTNDFSHFMGGYFAIKVVPTTDLLPANVSQIFSVPGQTAILNGYDDRTDIALAFRSDEEIEYDHRNRAQQRGMLHDHFDGLGWKVSDILEHLDADDDFYFDKINQIRMPLWSKGRVALVGDAGYCVSPLAGMGGSLAIVGAARLGDALRNHGKDYVTAFHEYHDKLHGFVDEIQEKAVNFGMAIMFPSDEAEIAERNRAIGSGVIDL
ncbi:FAD-dependent monooxygenase [Robbsia andropogonis]|uniref:FAD-dependent monooxygenase n=1 Tax=Robbsia andropogonis TaxID=28092 RepID=UPI0020A0064F|nr:FAD-dependent monooxygenase [Robbsia andropogonis]MCP1117981.1 FAD-dependent monooxygenase [Robbsia andropogonis]